MAEYIDRDKVLVELECGIRAGNYEEGYEKYMHINDMDDCVDTVKYFDIANVVEREKIDKAIEEIKGQFYVLLKDEISIEESIEEIWWNNALAKTLEIIKRNIGE